MKKSKPSGKRARRPGEAAPGRSRATRPGDGRPSEAARRGPVPMVGVGASAGGLDAFTQLLRGLPPAPGLAVVFVQHLSPSHESALSELLSKVTRLPVEQVRDRTAILANHVYVVPPNAELTVENGVLRLAPRPTDRTQYTPIDAFFRSLAESAAARAFGVLLSGTSADGVAGLREIRAAGGTVLVQDPETTEYQVMPRSAIAAGVADIVLPPKDIGVTLGRLVSHPLLSVREIGPRPPAPTVPDPQLRRVFAILRAASGVDFTHYKEPTIRRRIHRRMALQKAVDTSDYIRMLEESPVEVQNLYHDLLIQVTRFFREPDSYAALTETVFAQLVENRAADNPIRIWVPGCATGEEAYSVVITLLEFLGDAAGGTPIQVFATDVSEKAVERARSGIYPESIAEDVSAAQLRRFFIKTDGSYQIAKPVRDLCVFARQDLTRDPPFSKLDLIVCRNVLIYLDPVLHKKLMSLFHYALKPNGFLVLGRAESVGNYSDFFDVFDKKQRIFRRKPGPGHAEPLAQGVGAPSPKETQEHKSARGRDGSGLQSEATRVLLSRYAPPGVVVDNDLRIVQTRGQTGAFLELAPGEPSLSLYKMLREGLLYGVRAALGDARKTGHPARKEGIRLKSNGHHHTVNVEVIPLGAFSTERTFLVLFEDAGRGEPHPRAPADLLPPRKQPGGGGREPTRGRRRVEEGVPWRLRELQQELAASREYLQSIIQDLEATNEELQSANEEILSSNEELQSTNEELDTAKEELQSTNEEINTVNEELQARNEELSRANSDLINLLAGVQIAIVFVTNDMRIRRFTPMAEKALNLIPADVGRPIGNIRPNIDCPDLEDLIHDAIDNVTVREREVQDRAGNWVLLRIRPYKSVDNRIDGAVLVLLDIDALRKHEQRSKEAQNLAEAVLDSVTQPLLVLDGELRVAVANPAFAKAFAVSPGQVEGKPLVDICGGRWDIPELHARIAGANGDDDRPEPLEVTREFPGVGKKRMWVIARKIAVGDRRPSMVVLAIEELPDA